MTSADSCLLTIQVAPYGAGLSVTCLLPLFRISSLAEAFSQGYRDIWVPVAPAGLFTGSQTGPHERQVSPDKDMNFRCTTAPFTVPPEPPGFDIIGCLTQRLGLL
jgi:hypothetical protein